ncbi:MAG: hypothetical protein IKM45_01985 [Opitutales bacterium]|nr:hypothetical protein [Opitutales bacterium]
MKKVSIVLFIIAAVFAGTSAYLFLQNSDLQKENANLAEIDAQRKANDETFDLRAKNKIAETDLAQAREKNRELEKQLAASEELSLARQKALEEAAQKDIAQQQQIAEKESAAKIAQESADKDKAAIVELENALIEERKRTEELNGEVVRLRSNEDRQALEAQIAEKDQQLLELSKERDSLDEELAVRKLEIADLQQRLQAQVATANDRSAAADSRADEINAELEEAKKRIETLENQNRNLRRRLSNR